MEDRGEMPVAVCRLLLYGEPDRLFHVDQYPVWNAERTPFIGMLFGDKSGAAAQGILFFHASVSDCCNCQLLCVAVSGFKLVVFGYQIPFHSYECGGNL